MAQHITSQIHEATLQGLHQERASYVQRLKPLLEQGAPEADAYIASINRVNAAMTSLAQHYRPTASTSDLTI